ncbi:MAG: SHOCT domain-containing protein [Granulosicoccus sp.]
MQQLSTVGRQAVSDMSRRYNISAEAVEHMLISVNNGAGQMAQFNCPELGGSGQWMRGGMIMVGDMFNHGLKLTVDNLCNELSNLLANEQVFPELPAGTPGSANWWPAGLGSPISSGSQNNSRYALFAGRLAVDVNGQVTVYDTLDHQIGGVSQQQGGNDSLNFSSQFGTVPVSSLPIVSGTGGSQAPDTHFASAQDSGSMTSSQAQFSPEHTKTDSDVQGIASSANTYVQPANSNESDRNIVALIEKLGQLHGAGVLSDEEFSTKKQELLARL